VSCGARRSTCTCRNATRRIIHTHTHTHTHTPRHPTTHTHTNMQTHTHTHTYTHTHTHTHTHMQDVGYSSCTSRDAARRIIERAHGLTVLGNANRRYTISVHDIRSLRCVWNAIGWVSMRITRGQRLTCLSNKNLHPVGSSDTRHNISKLLITLAKTDLDIPRLLAVASEDRCSFYISIYLYLLMPPPFS
jgi:hypothetical protein